MGDRDGLKSVASAIELLNAFADEEELGVTDIARRLGVAKSTAHRLLTTLVAGGLVEQSAANGRYRLGLRLYELGYLVVGRQELVIAATPLLQELREISGWTVHLTVVRGADSLNLERLPTKRGMQAIAEVRRRWPLHATASGKVLCAFDPVAREARIAAGFPQLAPATISTRAEFDRVLASVRQRGYASSVDEIKAGLSSLAAPVLDIQGVARAAVSIAGSSEELRASSDRLAQLIIAAGRRLSTLLQHRTTG